MSYIVVKQTKNDKGILLKEEFYAGYKYLENKATDGVIWSNNRQDGFEFDSVEKATTWSLGEQWRTGPCVIQAK